MVEPGPDVKNVITTSSSEIVNASIAPGDDPGRRERQHDPEERLHRRGAEVGRGFDQPVVERGEARLHDDDDERDAERDVRGDHGPDAQLACARTAGRTRCSEMPITISGMTSEMKISVE